MINFRDNVKKMEGYVPGEQPPPGSRVIKLNTNENPYPPSPEVMKVLREFEGDGSGVIPTRWPRWPGRLRRRSMASPWTG